MNRAKWESLQIRIESFNLENGLEHVSSKHAQTLKKRAIEAII
jgi:hypothetical protein